MEIKKLFERGNAQTSSQSVQRNRVASTYQAQNEGNAARRPGQDSVSISALSRQLSQLSNILADDESARSAKVSELKAKVQAGEFSVESTDVARSMVSFAADTESIA